MALSAVPATPEQQAAFGSPTSGAPLDQAAIEQMTLPGFMVPQLWEGYTPAQYLVKRTLGPSQLTVLFGESGHFKSVIAIDLALCVASGREFHGLKTHKAGVVYVAGEGHGGLRKRVRAWLLHHGYDAASEQPSIYVTEAGADLIGNPLQLRATVEYARRALGCDIGLVVVDTLAANFGMGDENHASDMQTAIRGARDAAKGASVLMLHHTGHGDGKARERGSYAIRATADYRLRAVYDEPSKLVELQFLRVKDDEEPKPLHFVWRRVPLGWEDEDGEELTSVALEKAEAPAGGSVEGGAYDRTGTTGLGANQETALKVLQRLYRQHRKNVVDRGGGEDEAKVLLAGLRGTLTAEKRMPKQRITEAIEGLVRRGLARIEAPHIYLIEAEGECPI